VRRAINILYFLMLVNDGPITQTVYAERKMFAPFSWVDDVLFDPLPIKMRLFDLLFLVILLASGSRGQKVGPMRNALFLAIGTTLFFFALGMVRGGDSRYAGFQTYLMLAAPIAAFAIAATHTKPNHYRSLGKWIVAAAIYRAVMCLIFYFGFARQMEVVPAVMTTHGDSVLWIAAVGMLIANYLEQQTTSAKVMAFLFIPIMVLAVHFNNRRLAWVSLTFSLAALYFLLPPSAAKRKLKRIGMWMLPVLGAYVVVGWGRPERIFKPLASLSSVSSKPDSSTLARNVENLSLIATASYNPLTGSGWGHPYVELSNKYTIAGAMELWPYIPHNSLLGLFAYSGILGVMGYFLMIPTGVFLHARCARMSKDPRMRTVTIVGVMVTLTSLSQMFGDMGIFSVCTMYHLAAVWGGALRLPIEAGVWTNPGMARRTAAPATPPAPSPPAPAGPPPQS
jgi:hypothetical protein